MCSVHSLISRWYAVWNRWSVVYVYVPTVRMWMSLCRIHDTYVMKRMKLRRRRKKKQFWQNYLVVALFDREKHISFQHFHIQEILSANDREIKVNWIVGWVFWFELFAGSNSFFETDGLNTQKMPMSKWDIWMMRNVTTYSDNLSLLSIRSRSAFPNQLYALNPMGLEMHIFISWHYKPSVYSHCLTSK